jgi:hypothetical protein
MFSDNNSKADIMYSSLKSIVVDSSKIGKK